MVSDGLPRGPIDDWDCDHIRLPKSHNDTGNTPRAIGALSAMNLGHNPIIFLDADNWLMANHVEEALRIKGLIPDADVVALKRVIVLPDGTHVGSDWEDAQEHHIDSSCYSIFSTAFRLLPMWALMPTYLGRIGDRIIRNILDIENFKIGWSEKPTVFYTSKYSAHYRMAGRVPPEKTNNPNAVEIQAAYSASDFCERTGIDMPSLPDF